MIADADRSRLEDLLGRWEELRRDGHDATVEELCPGSPDLAAELGRRITAQRRLYEFLNLSEVDATTSLISPHSTASSQSRESASARAEYRDLRFHAAGGLGEVYLARNSELSRDVALKFLKQDKAGNPDNLRRFLLEAKITSRLEHPGVVPVYSVGADATGAPCYAMRFIRGETLQDALEAFHASDGPGRDPAERSLTLRSLLQRFISACNTVAYAHSRGVLHRDLKPSNVIVGKYDETLVVDWGLAEAFDRHEANDTSGEETVTPDSLDIGPAIPTIGAVGTPAYMSPEQAEGRWDQVGPGSDVYSLGATLYAILTGRAPFRGRDLFDILEQAKRGEFLTPRKLTPRVNRALDAIVRKAMAPRPVDRYQSPREIAADLNRWLADQPVSAHTEPLMVRSMRWIRKRKQLVAAATVLALMTLVGLALHDFLLGREQKRTKVALDQASGLLGLTRTALREQFESARTNLAAFPKTERLREKFATDALAIYQKLLESYPADPDIQYETAEVYQILAAIRRLTGRSEAALSCYEDSIKLFDGLANHPVHRFKARRGVVNNLVDRGELFRMNGRSKLAEDDFDTALERVKRLEDDPESWFHRTLRASAVIDRSEVRMLRGQIADAIADATEAINLLSVPVSSVEPRSFIDLGLWLLAMAHTDRGNALKEAGKSDHAEEDFRTAISRAEEISTSSIYDSSRRYQIAVTHNHYGELLQEDVTRRAQAEKAFLAAHPLLRPLAKDFPEMPYYREELATCLIGLGQARLSGGKDREAEQDCLAALALLDELRQSDPRNPQYLSLLGKLLAVQSQICATRSQQRQANDYLIKAIAGLQSALEIDPDRQLDRRQLDRFKIQLSEQRARQMSPRGPIWR